MLEILEVLKRDFNFIIIHVFSVQKDTTVRVTCERVFVFDHLRYEGFQQQRLLFSGFLIFSDSPNII